MSDFGALLCDVAIIGGGPGGCAAATLCADAGLKTLLIERDVQPRFKIGESLMPESYWTFERMGVLDKIRRHGFVEKHSVQFFAKSGKGSNPFYFRDLRDHDCSRTWQVHRAELDALLFDHAAERGADCRRGWRVVELIRDLDRVTGLVALDASGQRREISCQVVIDASGQSSVVARSLDLEREDYGLAHCSLFTHYRGAIRDPGRDEGATMILHTEAGESWFWYIPLRDDVVSVGVVGSIDYLIRQRAGGLEETFAQEVARCGEIARRIAGAERCRPLQVLKDFSYRSRRMAGPGWVLIGDAFSFIDPVYSSGVFLSLRAGEMAADAAIEAIHNGDLSAERLGAFEPRLQHGMAAVLGLVRAFYAPDFSFGTFLRTFPDRQQDVTRILVGDVFDHDFAGLFADMETFQRPLLANA